MLLKPVVSWFLLLLFRLVLPSPTSSLFGGDTNCRQVPAVENGYPTLLTSQPFLTAWQVNCNSFYRLVGPKLITCTISTGWSSYGKCTRRLECGQLPGIPNGYVTYSGPAGTADTEPSRNIKCNRGFELVGNDTIVCEATGKWSQPGICQPLYNCEFELEIANGYAEINRWNPTTATVTCCGGYRLKGVNGAMCNSATNWQWQWPGRCIATNWLQLYCGPTPIVNNGFVTSPGCSEFGATRNVICNEGFEIYGPDTTTCSPPGFWSTPGRCLPLVTTTITTTKITTRTTTTRLTPKQTPIMITSSYYFCGPARKYTSAALVEMARAGDQFGFYKELEAGADPNSRDDTSWTALIAAANSNQTRILSDLLACDADVNAKNSAGSTALMFAARIGSLGSVEMLLNWYANPNLRNNQGASALLLAAQNGHQEVVQALLRHRADFTVRNSDGNSALHLAVRGDYLEVVANLLENGAPPDVQNRLGQTPLMVACRNGYYRIANLLLTFGAEMSIVDLNGNTAANYAQSYGHTDVQSLLAQQDQAARSMDLK